MSFICAWRGNVIFKMCVDGTLTVNKNCVFVRCDILQVLLKLFRLQGYYIPRKNPEEGRVHFSCGRSLHQTVTQVFAQVSASRRSTCRATEIGLVF